MIKVKNFDKTYYKGKSNEIHVINDTSLELPDTGLICFLGQSGSGKTTLLNAIGGLDKTDKGSIEYDDTFIKKYNMSKIDAYRSQNIGYIFQNYLLLEDVSVLENLRIALDLIGINDPEEVKKRSEYVLKQVGLFKFRRKLAGQLSGGQQQRVSIARALIKKTKIVIADEPTGNLDSENTIEIMNILKKVSKEALVLVVTHNEEIANFYADRIVKLKDGKIESDEINESTGALEAKSDKKIHLLDLKEDEVSSGRLSVKMYSDDEDTAHNVTIIIKNNTIYIDSESRLQVVPGSNIELINDHYQKLEIDKVDDFDYDISWYDDNAKKSMFKESMKDLGRSFLSFYGASKRKFFNVVFILIGMAIAILVLLQTNFTSYDLSGVATESDIYYLRTKGEEESSYSGVNSEVILEAVNKGYIIDYVETPWDGTSIVANYNSTNGDTITLSKNVFPFSYVESKSLLVGTKPSTPKEIVLGKLEADRVIEKIGKDGFSYIDLIGLKSYDGNQTICGVSSAETNSVYKSFFSFGETVTRGWYDVERPTVEYYKRDKYTISSGEDLLSTDVNKVVASEATGLEVGDTIKYSYFENDVNKEILYTVKGLTDSTEMTMIYTNDYGMLGFDFQIGDDVNPGFFYSKEALIEEKNMYYDVYDMNLVDYTIVQGHDVTNDNECIVSAYAGYKLNQKLNGMTIVGTFYPTNTTFDYNTAQMINTGVSTYNCFLTTTKSSISTSLSYYINMYGKYNEFYEQIYHIDSSKINEAKEYFDSKDLSVLNVGETQKTDIINDAKKSKNVYPIIEAILLAVILVYTYFSERAKMINEIYDIGVLRSLGAKRRKIFFRTLKELFVKASLTTFLGYVVTIVLYIALAININKLVETKLLSYNPLYILLGIIILYSSQLFIGVLPYMLLMRKSPSEINSKYDI